MKQKLRIGALTFQDPLILCGTLAILLYFDASSFLRIGLLAAFLHEMGHILVYIALCHRLPYIEVTMTGFCMRIRGERFSSYEEFLLAAAGPGMNVLLMIWAAFCVSQQATIRMSAFFAANLLTGAFNLLPIPPLDGAQILRSLIQFASDK